VTTSKQPPPSGSAPLFAPIRTPFVGREAERASLTRLIEQTANGQGALAMIGGEPGVGKTRLSEELASEARERGFLSVVGHCYDMEGGQPYQPFVEAMEHLTRVVPIDDLQQWLGDDAPDVARLAPDLRRLFPELADAGEVPPEEGRRLLLTAWSDFLARAAAARPILLILDDVHWADESSLLLLQHIARRLAETPVLILCTYRDGELDVNRPLAKTLQELVRQRLVRDILIRRLPEQGVAGMIEAHGPSAPPAELVSLVYSETDGNPFFVEEVLRHLAEEYKLFGSDGAWASGVAIGEVEVPRTVRLVIEQRLARLSEGCRQLLASAAVVGRDFSFDILGDLGDLGPEASSTLSRKLNERRSSEIPRWAARRATPSITNWYARP
jgi:predicted ATPase